MKVRPVNWSERFALQPRRRQNLRGPRRALPYDEQLEVRAAMQRALHRHERGEVALRLAADHGVSVRTIWRYAKPDVVAVPKGAEFMAARVRDWADERGIGLTRDDLESLLIAIARGRQDAA